MSLNGYNQGFGNGSAAGRALAVAVDRDADEAIGEWKQFAGDLNAKLAKAESSRIGFAHLLREVSAELQRVDPDNPLLNKAKQLAIIRDQAVKKAAELGYTYDPATDAIYPRR